MFALTKKIVSIFLAVSTILLTVGCSSTNGGLFNLTNNQSENKKNKTIQLSSLSLPVDYTDSFNPFKATTVANKNFFPLIYDSLFKLDEHFYANKCLATRMINKNKQVRITLIGGIKFSDNTPMTPYDVKYSLNKAKSSPLYSVQLKNISSVECDSKTIQITLEKYDPNFYNCLDTPIVKENTAEGSNIPIGSGRYILDNEKSQYTLNYNKDHFENKKPHFKKINLIGVPDSEAIMTSVKTGQIHAMFSDLRDGEVGGIYANTVSVNLNNMVYIGINAKGALADSEMRRAISYAFKRSLIVSKGYSSRGTATYLPINPLFDDKQNVKVPTYSITTSTKLINGLGYTKTDLNGIRKKNKNKLTISLLINSDNNYKVLTAKAIQSALQSVGINIKIVTVKNVSALQNKIKAGKFELYLGETRLLNNMDISEFFTSGILSKGIDEKEALNEKYNDYLESGNITPFAKLFFKEMPFIPLLFRSGIVAYNGNISTELVSTPTDIYDNILDWK